jgi:hypothetical protein
LRGLAKGLDSRRNRPEASHSRGEEDCWGYSGVMKGEGGKAIRRTTPFVWDQTVGKWDVSSLRGRSSRLFRTVLICERYQMWISFNSG